MVAMLAFVLWLTVAGANYRRPGCSTCCWAPSIRVLKSAAACAGLPWWLDGLLIDGMYLATAWVVSVMLPPMAIFFPMFTLLEDFGYLPRVAFNLDATFRRCGAHGKQALTMCMGFGCNAAGVVATRVIDSPRERLIAIMTNNFSLCNGRWPTQILIATIFVGSLVPPYLSGRGRGRRGRRRRLAGRGVHVPGRLGLVPHDAPRRGLDVSPGTAALPSAAAAADPVHLADRPHDLRALAGDRVRPAGRGRDLAGGQRAVGGWPLAEWAIDWLDPVGVLLGLNGVILLAYVVAIPANEIVIPTVLMLTVLTTGCPTSDRAGGDVRGRVGHGHGEVLRAGGWTVLTGINLMLFSLLHNPCSTTIYTIWKETRSVKWTVLATLMPLALGVAVCFVVAQMWQLIRG